MFVKRQRFDVGPRKPIFIQSTLQYESALHIYIHGGQTTPGLQNNSQEHSVVHVAFAVPPGANVGAPAPSQEYPASMHGKALQNPKPPQFTTQLQPGMGGPGCAELVNDGIDRDVGGLTARLSSADPSRAGAGCEQR
jgi:hypothetical protein